MIVRGVAMTIAAAVVLGGYQYAVNKHQTGTWLGGLYESVDRTDSTQSSGFQVGIEGNVGRLAWHFVDLPGYGAPAIERPLRRAGELVAGGLDDGGAFDFSISSTPNEDLAGFGPLVPLVLFPVALFFLFARGGGRDRRVLVLAALAFMATFAYLFSWNIYVARLLIVPMALLAPLLAALAGRPALRTVAVTIALIGAMPAILINDIRPIFAPPIDSRLAGEPSVLTMDRITQQTIALPQMRAVLAAVDDALPTGTLGLIDGNDDVHDYQLFGPRFDRRVVRIRLDDLTQATLRREGIGAVLCEECPRRTMPPGARAIQRRYWLLEAGSADLPAR